MKYCKRNICVVGFNRDFNDNFMSLDYKEIVRNEYSWKYQYLSRYPNIVLLDNIKDVRRRTGFIIFINGNNIDDIQEFDFNNRKFYKQFNYVVIIKDNVENTGFDKFSHISLMNSDIYWFGLSEFVEELYIDYVKNYQVKKYQQNRLVLLDDIHNYLKKGIFVKSKDIAQEFGISLRKVQRYMLDINAIYRDIGYDYKGKEYYVVK